MAFLRKFFILLLTLVTLVAAKEKHEPIVYTSDQLNRLSEKKMKKLVMNNWKLCQNFEGEAYKGCLTDALKTVLARNDFDNLRFRLFMFIDQQISEDTRREVHERIIQEALTKMKANKEARDTYATILRNLMAESPYPSVKNLFANSQPGL